GPDPKHVEVVRRYEGGLEGTRLGQGCPHPGFGEAGQTFETGYPRESADNVRVVRPYRPAESQSEIATALNPDLHQAILIPETRKRAMHQAIDHCEGQDHRRQTQAETPDHREREPAR